MWVDVQCGMCIYCVSVWANVQCVSVWNQPVTNYMYSKLNFNIVLFITIYIASHQSHCLVVLSDWLYDMEVELWVAQTQCV